MEKILEKIKEFDTIIIHGHARPDGDCIGSQYGLMHLIKESFPNKKVYVTGETSEYVSFLGKPEMIDEKVFQNALSICVDCGNKERLSDTRFDLSKFSIKIDHHFDSDDYADYNFVDATAASCTQIITEFYMRFKDELKMNKECATSLYTGILTDSGRFKYKSVSAKTFMCAAELINNNIDLDYIDNQLSIENEKVLRLKGYCLSNFKITQNGFAYITLEKDEIEKFGVDNETAASLVTSISTLEGCLVWALIMDTGKDIRVRLRSKGPEVNVLASNFSGGGHKLASGATLKSWDDLEKLINGVHSLLEEYEEKQKTLQKTFT